MKYKYPEREVRTRDGVPFYTKNAGARQAFYHEGTTFIIALLFSILGFVLALLGSWIVASIAAAVMILWLTGLVRNFRRIERNRVNFPRSVTGTYLSLNEKNRDRLRPAAKAIYKDKSVDSSKHPLNVKFYETSHLLWERQHEEAREMTKAIEKRTVENPALSILNAVNDETEQYREVRKMQSMGEKDLKEYLAEKGYSFPEVV